MYTSKKMIWTGFKVDFIQSQGYSSVSDYRIGRAANGSFIGWSGHLGLSTSQFFEQVPFKLTSSGCFDAKLL